MEPSGALDTASPFDSEPLGDPLDPITSDDGQRSSMSEADGINMMVDNDVSDHLNLIYKTA